MAAATIPRHIAVVMDGNGRWAKKRLLPRKLGHREGAKAVRNLVESCARKGIEVLSLFAFSSENWNRPQDEVNELMTLFFTNLEKELPTLMNNNIRLRVIGDRSALSNELQQRVGDVEKKTETNNHMNLVLAVSYGGRWDITNAVKQLMLKVQSNDINLDDVDETLLTRYLSTAELPEPDLFIRSSGEQRISNFLIWQLAYAELYFTDKLWPDFDDKEFEKALAFYASRERRFGLTTEQLSQGE